MPQLRKIINVYPLRYKNMNSSHGNIIFYQLDEVDLKLPELEEDVDLILPLRISLASPINVCNI